MPAAIEWEQQGLIVRLSGAVTGDDLLRLLSLVRADSRYAEAGYAILDCVPAESFCLKAQDYCAMADLLKALHRPGRVMAAVARGRYALAFARRCLRLRTHPMRAEMFTNFDDARRWIEDQSDQRHKGP
jgi:hypothetical protein